MKNLFHKLKHFYDNLKIQNKFTLAILLAVIIPISALSVAFFGQLYDMIIADTIRNEQAATALTAPKIEEALTTVTAVHDTMEDMPYYRTLFCQPIHETLPTLAASPDAFEFSNDIRTLTSNEAISTIKIYLESPCGDSFFDCASAKDVFLPLSHAKGTYWYGIFQGSNSAALYCPSFYLGKKEQENYGDAAYITRTSLYYEDTAYPCYVAIYYSSAPYRDILTAGIDFPGSVSYIINDREALVASTDDYLAGIYRLSYSDIKDSLMSSNNFMERTVLGEKLYVGFYYIKQPGWFMVTVLPRKPLIHKGNLVILKFICICFICVLAAAIIALWQARSITTRISSVIQQMTQVRKGPPVPMPAPIIQDEIGELINTYNYMTDKMNLLIARQQKTAEELRIAEFNSLQAQINPHFLYNTMDMINWMALAGRTGEISNVVQSLARFYKLTLSRKKNFSTIENEIEHVSIYVQLQNMRYQNAIDFVVDIPDELLEYSIPKLTLQPIVENAILHGILEKPSKSGTIVLTGWLEQENLLLFISDNGVGIPADKLSLILSDNNISNTKGSNIAIYNIHKRFKLLYGPSYGLSYTSTPQKGTEVKICIPTHSRKMSDTFTDQDTSLLQHYHLSTLVDTNDAFASSTGELLAHCQKLQGNTLTLDALSDIAFGFPKGETLCLLYHEMTTDFPLHNHAFYEISYVCEGTLNMNIDGQEIWMHAGDMVIMNTAAFHSLTYTGSPAVLLNISLPPALLTGALCGVMENDNILSELFLHKKNSVENYLFLSLRQNPKYEACLTDILETYILYDYHSSLELTSLLLYFFSMLIDSENYRFHGTDEHTCHMITYLREHKSVSLEQAARHFHCSIPEMKCRIEEKTGRSLESFL